MAINRIGVVLGALSLAWPTLAQSTNATCYTNFDWVCNPFDMLREARAHRFLAVEQLEGPESVPAVGVSAWSLFDGSGV